MQFGRTHIKLVSIASMLLCSLAGQAAGYSTLPEPVKIGQHPKASVPFALDDLKARWRQRISAMRQAGVLPIIDIESSFNPGKVDAQRYAQSMDDSGIALTAFSPQIGTNKYRKSGALWRDGAQRAVGADPSRHIPASTAGIYPAWTTEPEVFVEETIRRVASENYPLMGEFEFRHYMSPRQYKRNETYRDVSVPIDSAAGHRLFAFSQQSGISFQIHYEVEDALLPPLEAMLAQYPGARVIWCHLAQVRYSERARTYGPAYVRSLIEKYPNIYFDLAFGSAESVYPGSGERHATVWRADGSVKPEWVQLISDHPYRFLAALDIGGDRVDQVRWRSQTLRTFMDALPADIREIVAYKAAWKLLFKEDI